MGKKLLFFRKFVKKHKKYNNYNNNKREKTQQNYLKKGVRTSGYQEKCDSLQIASADIV